MAKGEQAIEAICEGCGKTCRVPRAGRVYQCRACGGRVRADDPEAGTLLEGEEPLEDDYEDRYARADLRRAHRLIRATRFTYYVFAGLFAINTILLGLGALAMESTGFVVATVLMAAMVPVLVLLGWFVNRYPIACTLPMALLATVWGSLLFLAGEISFVVSAYTIASWASVALMFRAKGIMEQHPDFYLTQRIQGTRRLRRHDRRDGPSPNERVRGRSRAGDGSSLLLRLGIWGAFVAIGVGIAVVLYVKSLPPSFEPTRARFEAAWAGSDLEGIDALFRDRSRAKMGRALEAWIERLEWSAEDLPALGAASVETISDTRTKVRWIVPGGELETGWRVEDGRWALTLVRLPKP